jgi:hypothetical protein
MQLERIAGEWTFAAGYAGQATTEHREQYGFSPTRGFARSIVMHAGYTIDVNRSVTFEGIVRQNEKGAWVKAEYTQALGSALAGHGRRGSRARGERRFHRAIPSQLAWNSQAAV